MKTNIASTICVVVLLALVVGLPVCAEDSDEAFEKQFQQKLDAWNKARSAWIEANGHYSYLGGAKDEAKDLISLGSRAIPCWIDLYRKQLEKRTWDNRYQADVFELVSTATGKVFSRSELPWKKILDMSFVQQLYVDWWKTGRLQTSVKFATLFAQWDSQARSGNPKETDKTVARIKTMGIEIMPLVMEKSGTGTSVWCLGLS